MRTRLLAFLVSMFCLGYPLCSAQTAVESIGEINVLGDPLGRVPASSKAPLRITLAIDRSRAEPVTEDIKTFEIVLPPGFRAQPLDVQKLALDRVEEPGFTVKLTGNSLWVMLDTPITDTRANRIVEIDFMATTPDVVVPEAVFGVRMRNPIGIIIGEFIRAGNADQAINNDDFSLEVIPNVPPPPPPMLRAQLVPGENNVSLTWEAVPDLGESGGYFIYRDGERIDDLKLATASSYTDVNAPPGDHVYGIEAYKTPLLRSELLEAEKITVEPDTTPPEPPRDFQVEIEASRALLRWRASLSPDVVSYRAERQDPDGRVESIAEQILPDQVTDGGTFELVHPGVLETGRYVYRIFAIDEAGLSSASEVEIRLFDKPFPNPFTPSSPDAHFNQVTFRTTRSSDASFSVQIYDLHGALVWGNVADAGKNELAWDGRDDDGEMVRSGIYIYQMLLGDEVVGTGTVIVAK